MFIWSIWYNITWYNIIWYNIIRCNTGMYVYIYIYIYICKACSALPPATWKHGWSKQGSSIINYTEYICECFDGTMLEPCLLQPCFHVAGPCPLAASLPPGPLCQTYIYIYTYIYLRVVIYIYIYAYTSLSLYIYIYIYTAIIRPIPLLTLSLLTLLDSNFQVNSLWTWEFHPLKLRLCSSQTLWNPQC